MPVTNYYTIDGSIIGESTGGVRTDYLTDALGSVTATVDSTGTVLNTYRYKASGEVLAKTGTAPDPKFLHVGSLGYRQTGRKYSSTYIRERHYDSITGRWTTKDPLGYESEANFSFYHYVKSNPTTLVDPKGLQTIIPHRSACEGKINDCPPKYSGIADNLCGKLRNNRFDAKLLRKINECKKHSGVVCPDLTHDNIGSLLRICKGSLKITCNGVLPNDPKPCDSTTCAQAQAIGILPCNIVMCTDYIKTSNCKVGKCMGLDSNISGSLLHEMLHCAGIAHGKDDGYDSCNDVFACCILALLQGQKDANKCCKRK